MTRPLSRGWYYFLALLCLLVAAMAAGGQAVARADDPPPVDRMTSEREVLVLLRLPAEHFTPGASYGPGYGGGEGRGARRRFAQERAHANGLTLVDSWPMPLVGLDCYVMAVPSGRSTEAAAAALSHDPGVEWAEPMKTYRAQGMAVAPAAIKPMSGVTTDDPLYRVQPAALEWRLDALHRIATGRNIRVAIIDSAIDVNHPDLIGQVAASENFVDNRSDLAEIHGTGVAGIIAAVAGNGKGIVGVAPRARLMGMRACWQETPAETLCNSLSLAKALHYSIEHKAEVINMSLSGPPDVLLARLLDVAQARGITVVGAVDRNLPGGGFPASHPGVVAVIDEGPDPPPAGSFAAPGHDIPTTQPGGNWSFVNGSSYAAAHVSGLFALMREKNSRFLSAPALSILQGNGAIDPCATLLRAMAAADGECVTPALAQEGGGSHAAAAPAHMPSQARP